MENNKLVEVNMNIFNLDNCNNYLQIQLGDEIHDVKIVGTFDETWFCGKDICRILGYGDVKQALQHNIEPEYKNFLLNLRVYLGDTLVFW